MVQISALITGMTLAVMISINGHLTAEFGIFPAAAIIHAVGSLFAMILCAFQKPQKPLWGHQPFWIYLGGAIGVFTTVFNNLAFGRISMTSIVALGLLGQTVMSLIVDSAGLLGMKKQPFQKNSIPGLIFALIGVFIMLDQTVREAVIAVIVSFVAGVSVVLSRSVNSRLAEKAGALRGSLINHLVGLPITILLAAASLRRAGDPINVEFPIRPWIFLGGVLGVTVVLLCNLTVSHLSAFRLTLLTFIGQVFTGIWLDLSAGNGYSDVTFRGGLIIAGGVLLSWLTEWIAAKRFKQRSVS